MDSIERIDTPADHEDEGRTREFTGAETFESILDQHIERRSLLKGAAAALPFMAAPGALSMVAEEAAAQSLDNALTFTNVAENQLDRVTVPPGYKTDVVIRWGDPLFPGMPAFDVNAQSPADQARRFGFNCDMISIFPERFGAPATIGRLPYPSYIMCVNHEYTSGRNMFATYTASQEQALTEIEAHGVTVVGVRLRNNTWTYDQNSRYNRRITGSTPMTVRGPAAGHPLLRTPADPAGNRVLGTLNNCAGGYTPWGTYLTCEENFHQYFGGRSRMTNVNKAADHADLGVPSGTSGRRWELYDTRFDVGVAAGENEPFRHGYVVEIDPYEPTSTPVKRTALGRFKHEGAAVVLNAQNRVVVYSGDDEVFDYCYKFVASGTFDPSNPRSDANMNLLDSGTLYAARFNADGTGVWLALDINNATTGPLLRASRYADGTPRFPTNAEIYIHTRRAGDAVGATPMDRPEDIEAPHNDKFYGNGKVYMTMTNNSGRGVAATAPRGRSSAVDAANPRANNRTGHIIEVTEAGNDPTALTFTWRIFLLAGDPAAAATSNISVRGTMAGDRFGSPDNIAFDKGGNIWIATDGNPNSFPSGDVVIVAPTTTPPGQPVPTKRFLVTPPGSECCGPLLSPDNSTFFAAIQHPGEDAAGVTTNTQSRWPDGQYPRPSVIAVRRTDGGRVGS